MKFDRYKIYVNDFIGLNKIEKINDRFLQLDLFKTVDTNITDNIGFSSLDRLRDYTKRPLYVLDTLDDLADFIKGKRDFPIFKTDEEEQKEKEEDKKSQECDNREYKLEKLKDIIGDLFDSNLDKNEDSYTGISKICNNDCGKNDYDCRNCFVNYIQRIVA